MPQDTIGLAGRRLNVDYVALAGTIIIPVIASFFLPAVSTRYRTGVGIVIGAVALLSLLFYFGRALRRELHATTTSLTNLLMDFTNDQSSGTLFKGALRNVSLRVATIQKLVDTLASAIPPEIRNETLEQAGYVVGRGWGHDFTAECRRTGLEDADLDAKLHRWADYDATAGLGRFEFSVSSGGYGSVVVHSGFLSDLDCECVLDYFFEGYLRGTLEALLARSLIVQLVDPTPLRHEESVFRVAPAA